MLDAGTAAVSVNRVKEVWTFHYHNTSLYAGKRVTLGRKTVDSFYFSAGVSLGGMGLRCKPHRERAGKDRREE